MNIKNICISALCIVGSYGANAQNTLNSKQLIGITPMVCNELNFPTDANKAITQKLIQISTKNGFGSTSGAFIITANPVITSKQATATAPSQYIVDVDMSIFVVNVADELIIGEITVPLKGIDRLENRAFMSAVRSLKSNDPTIRNFMEQTRAKIVDYYVTQSPGLLDKAGALAQQGEYKKAMSILSSIPTFTDVYPAVLELMNDVHSKQIELNTTQLMQTAKAEIIDEDYPAAMSTIASVDPASPNAKEAYAMLDEVSKKFEKYKEKQNESERKELEEEKRRFDIVRKDMNKLQADKVALEAATTKSLKLSGATNEEAKNMINATISKAVASMILGS